MESHEAIKKLIGKDIDEIARTLGIARSTVYKWMEPSGDWSDSGARNPLDRLELMIRAAKECGRDKQAFLPIHYLARRFGGVFLQLPKRQCHLMEIHQKLSDTVKEYGEMMAATGEALADGRIDKQEKKKVLKETDEAIEQLVMFKKLIERVR